MAQYSSMRLKLLDRENIRLSMALSEIPRMQYSVLRSQISKNICFGFHSKTGQDNFTRPEYVVEEGSFSIQTQKDLNRSKIH